MKDRIIIEVNIHKDIHDKVYNAIKKALEEIPEMNSVTEIPEGHDWLE